MDFESLSTRLLNDSLGFLSGMTFWEALEAGH